MSGSIDRKYVSDEDKFFHKLNRETQKTLSQQQEIAKHQSIAHKRDDKKYADDDSKLWDGF